MESLGNIELCEFVNKSKLQSLITSGLLKEETVSSGITSLQSKVEELIAKQLKGLGYDL
jgi:hypothetical protein